MYRRRGTTQEEDPSRAAGRADRKGGWRSGLAEDVRDLLTTTDRLAEGALERAHERARTAATERLRASAYGEDREVEDSVTRQLHTREQEALDRAWPAAVKAGAARRAEAVAVLVVRLVRVRAWVTAACLVGSVGLVVVVGFITEPDESAGDLTGWKAAVSYVGGGLCLAVVVLGLWIGVERVAADSGDSRTRALQKSRAAAGATRQALEQKLLDEWALPVVDSVVETRRSPTFASTLSVDDVSTFGKSALVVVETAAFDLVEELLASPDGLSIGLCGPRGVGKTTLIRRLCRPAKATDRRPRVTGLTLEVPVAFDQRDFLVTLFDRLLTHVEGDLRAGRRPWWPRLLQALAALTLLATGWLAWVRWGPEQGDLAGSDLLGLSRARWAAIAVLGAVTVALLTLVVRRRGRRRDQPPEEGRPPDLVALVRRCRDDLAADIATLAGVKGTFALRGVGIERSATRQVFRGTLTYPQLLERFKELLVALVRDGAVVRIGIDELDKLPTDDARVFLNNLKAIFSVDGVYYFVSVSEDAMSDFERRGLPIRDAFDSSLDDVVRLDEMTVKQSMRMLSNFSFPLSFGALCHCLSGGLPRELIRVARKLVRANAELKEGPGHGEMTALCSRLIQDDLTAKSRAVWVVARTITAEPYGTRYRGWFAAMDRAPHRAEDLLDSCREYLSFPDLRVADAPAALEEATTALARLDALTLEFMGYRYFAATLLEFFTSTRDQELREAIDDRVGPGGLHTLSSARRRFADDPRLAWGLVSDFRQARALGPLDVPVEGGRLPPSRPAVW